MAFHIAIDHGGKKQSRKQDCISAVASPSGNHSLIYDLYFGFIGCGDLDDFCLLASYLNTVKVTVSSPPTNVFRLQSYL
jgi:hypothetical protein